MDLRKLIDKDLQLIQEYPLRNVSDMKKFTLVDALDEVKYDDWHGVDTKEKDKREALIRKLFLAKLNPELRKAAEAGAASFTDEIAFQDFCIGDTYETEKLATKDSNLAALSKVLSSYWREIFEEQVDFIFYGELSGKLRKEFRGWGVI